jgi:hypothetical protein
LASDRPIVVLDGASSVLPYDFQLIAALAASGRAVRFCGSRTAYNGGLIDAMRSLPGVAFDVAGISGTVVPRWRGALAYPCLLLRVLWRGRHTELVNLQFSVAWPLEWLLLAPLRRKLVLTVHNAVPHGHGEGAHAPTARLARLAHRLIFVSEATRDEFLRRYGDRYRAKATLLPHGLLPIAPGVQPVRPEPVVQPSALVFWGNVKPYKGVELFELLAQSQGVAARALSLRVMGRWDGQADLKQRLCTLGVEVNDRYLADDEFRALFAQSVVFLLPYRHASQSGALYTLLHHGGVFICGDSGDLSVFLRRHGLDGLVLREHSAQAVLDCLDWLAAHREQVADALRRAQAELAWSSLLAAHPEAYAPMGAR